MDKNFETSERFVYWKDSRQSLRVNGGRSGDWHVLYYEKESLQIEGRDYAELARNLKNTCPDLELNRDRLYRPDSGEVVNIDASEKKGSFDSLGDYTHRFEQATEDDIKNLCDVFVELG